MGIKLRKPLRKFAEAMERELQENDHKGGWRGMPVEEMMSRLKQEVAELEQALADAEPIDVMTEAADVANFAMFIFDHARRETGDANG